MTPAFYALYDSLNAEYDLDVDRLNAEDLLGLCRDAMRPFAAQEELDWRAHQLRRHIEEAYDDAGYVTNDDRFYVAGLLEVLQQLYQMPRQDGD